MDAKKLSTILGLALLLTLIIPHAFSSELPLLEGRRLRPMVIDKYPAGNVYIGGTTGGRKRPAGSGLIMDREPSYVTPENDFKQSRIHPRPDVWNWKEADAWVEYCQKQQQALPICGPIGPQCSAWAKNNNRTAGKLNQNLVEFMTSLCQTL